MRLWLRALLGLALLVGCSEPGHAATDLSIMQPPEIEALQKRLTDDGCYSGPIDGHPTDSTTKAVNTCPDQAPVLRIEIGLHTALIRGLGVDASCALLATGSDDKTVRLWSMPDGHLLRTFRLPIGDGNKGKIFATALSPDGRTITAGGWNAAPDPAQGEDDVRGTVYTIDVSSGDVRQLATFLAPIVHLAFSADGTRVGVGLEEGGVRVLDRVTGRVLLDDRNYDQPAYGIAFSPDGSFLATSYDGDIRRYDPKLGLAVRTRAPAGHHPSEIAVDPSGRRIAVGYTDTTAVSLLNALTLKTAAKMQNKDVTEGNFNGVAWIGDGRELFAAGTANEMIAGKQQRLLRRFGAAGKSLGSDIGLGKNSIFEMAPCGGNIAFVADDPSFGLISPDGTMQKLQGSATADLSGNLGTAFTVSESGAAVRFGLDSETDRPVLFDLSAGTLSEASEAPPSLHPATLEGLPVTDWSFSFEPKLDGATLELGQNEVSRSLAIRGDRSGFVLGAEYTLRSFDAKGLQRWSKPAPGATWGVNFSAEDRIVIAAYGDGTIRWHRWSDGQELLALFVNAVTKAWVAWTPTGYYMSSPGGEDMIGWHVNRGWAQQPDFFPASRFRTSSTGPTSSVRCCKPLMRTEAVKQANAAGGAPRGPKAHPRALAAGHHDPVAERGEHASRPAWSRSATSTRHALRRHGRPHVEAFVDGAKIEARGLGPASSEPRRRHGALCCPCRTTTPRSAWWPMRTARPATRPGCGSKARSWPVPASRRPRTRCSSRASTPC